MKVLLRDYLASLRERTELDVILPDLLSEKGFEVFARPQVGTVQHGVDIGAVGLDQNGVRSVFLLSVKRGDLTLSEWDGAANQALRPSLNQILDAYPSRLPPEYAALPIIICLCFGGEIADNVRTSVKGYIEDNTRPGRRFEIWNGDKIAGLLLDGLLREDIFPKALRSDLRKALAMLDEPAVAYDHYARLADRLALNAKTSSSAAVTAARQLNIANWMIYVWARDLENLEAAYRTSELGVLHAWELLKPTIEAKGKDKEALDRSLMQMINLHLSVARDLLKDKIAPASRSRDALASAVRTRTSTDINLALFDIVGRAGMASLWMHWLGQRTDWAATGQDFNEDCRLYADLAMDIVESNGCLGLPIADQQAIDVALVLLAALGSEQNPDRISDWIETMVDRLVFAMRMRRLYPGAGSDYRDWIDPPSDDERFRRATVGSTLIPLLAAWASALSLPRARARLAALRRDILAHTTMQMWLPDADSETHHYLDSEEHGHALLDLPIEAKGAALLETIREACDSHPELDGMSAMRTNCWPIVLLASRHWRRPMPPQFYIGSMAPADEGGAPSSAG
ncbi:MAG TPA: hypothetical protein DGP25_09655 [Brevundimonas sp.]|nr:hypothetical protein [Brevundimonas sp.]